MYSLISIIISIVVFFLLVYGYAYFIKLKHDRHWNDLDDLEKIFIIGLSIFISIFWIIIPVVLILYTFGYVVIGGLMKLMNYIIPKE